MIARRSNIKLNLHRLNSHYILEQNTNFLARINYWLYGIYGNHMSVQKAAICAGDQDGEAAIELQSEHGGNILAQW